LRIADHYIVSSLAAGENKQRRMGIMAVPIFVVLHGGWQRCG